MNNRLQIGRSQAGWMMLVGVAVAGVLLLAVSSLVSDPTPVLAFTPGENGHPTSGNHTDLKGHAGDVALTFKTNMTISCAPGNIAQQFNMQLDYTISGAPLPTGAFVMIYLSPNNGAINNNSGGNEPLYIQTVESRVPPSPTPVTEVRPGALPPTGEGTGNATSLWSMLLGGMLSALGMALVLGGLRLRPSDAE